MAEKKAKSRAEKKTKKQKSARSGEAKPKKAKKAAKAERKAATKEAAKKPAKKAAGAKAGKQNKKADGASKKGKLFSTPKDVHLLVVDDEPEVLNLLVPFLKKRGYTVSEAEDGDEALEKILNERPNVVLLDVMMPGLNGWEISQYVRDRPELDPVRIIMATGIGENMNAATAPLYGADACIDKPFRLEDVENAVRDVIHRIESGQLPSAAPSGAGWSPSARA